MTTFEQPELFDAAQSHQIYSVNAYRMMTFKISTRDGTYQALQAASEIPTENVLEGFVHVKITGSSSAPHCIGYVRTRKRSK